jgi:hypothetical protein
MIRWVRTFIKEHPGWALGIVGLGLALFIFGIVWFEPQKLFIDERIDEAVPAAATGAEPSPTADPSPAEEEASGPTVLARGKWHSLEHATSGRVKILELGDGRRVLRFENLSTSNGPDLRVYLSEIPESDDWYAYGVRFIDLGDMKGNLGNQNYRIPKGADLSKIESAVIWCRRFEVGFAVAGLSFT